MTANPIVKKHLPPQQAAFKKPAVIINIAAGSATDITDDIVGMFKRFNLPEPAVHLVTPPEIGAALEKVKRDVTDLLVIYGGDGTCKAGAITARDANIPLIALPGGTMNMLPKALYGTDDWKTALELALSEKTLRWQVAGTINEHIFFCGAIIGDPIVMSEARESLREGDVIEAVKQLPDIMAAIAHGERFEFKVDGKVFDTESNGLQIYCPFMTAGATSPDKFEIASVPQLSLSELLWVGARALTQDWRDSVHVITAHARQLQIKGQGAFDILLDGEAEQVSCPISIDIQNEGVLVLAPDLHKAASK